MYKLYLITNKINKKQYVGLTKLSIDTRFEQHTKRGFLLTESIKKYSKENFSIETLEEVESSERAYELEQYYIKKYNTKAPNGYNLTDGGDGVYGWKPTEEYRKECSERVKLLHKEKKVGMYGKVHTEDAKLKISKSHQGKPKPWLKGKTLSEESKEKIRQKHLGKIVSEQTKKKISENHHDVSGKNNPMYGRKHSPETIEKLRQKQKNREKRLWINNGTEEKLILVNESIPTGYIKGRLK